MRAWGAIVVCIALIVGLTGCAGAPVLGQATPSEPRTTTSTPNAAEEEAAKSVTAIEIHGDGVRFLAGDELRTLRYDAPIDSALAAFAEALGPQTSTKEWPATNHSAPATEHRFGDVWIVEYHYDGMPKPVETDAVVHPVWSVSTRLSQSGDVRIGAAGGVAVGSSVEAVDGWDEPGRLGTLQLSDHTMAELLVEAAPGYPLVPDGSRGAYGVLAVAERSPGPITLLTAPSQYGGA